MNFFQKSKKVPEKLIDSLPSVCLSVRFKDKHVKLVEDRLTATGDKGYVTACATHCAFRGTWYYEIELLPGKPDSHIRVGWSTRRTRFDFPIGSDIYSYAMRSKDGAKIVQGIRKDYGFPFTAGSVIGCLLTLPEHGNTKTAIDYEDPVWLPGLLCDPSSPSLPEILTGTSIEWSIDGKRLGEGFINVVEGAYYPAVSLYNGARVKFNFGPDFKHPQPGFKAASELFDPLSHMKPPRRPPTYICRGALEDQIHA